MILLLIRKVRYKSLVSWLGDVGSVVLTLEIIASKRLFCRGGGTGPAGPVLATPSGSLLQGWRNRSGCSGFGRTTFHSKIMRFIILD